MSTDQVSIPVFHGAPFAYEPIGTCMLNARAADIISSLVRMGGSDGFDVSIGVSEHTSALTCITLIPKPANPTGKEREVSAPIFYEGQPTVPRFLKNERAVNQCAEPPDEKSQKKPRASDKIYALIDSIADHNYQAGIAEGGQRLGGKVIQAIDGWRETEKNSRDIKANRANEAWRILLALGVGGLEGAVVGVQANPQIATDKPPCIYYLRDKGEYSLSEDSLLNHANVITIEVGHRYLFRVQEDAYGFQFDEQYDDLEVLEISLDGRYVQVENARLRQWVRLHDLIPRAELGTESVITEEA